MKKSRFTEEQIIAILAEGGAGAATKDVCRRFGYRRLFILLRRQGRRIPSVSKNMAP